MKSFRLSTLSMFMIQAGILTTFALVPVWYRFRGFPSFSTFYGAGFLIFWTMLWTIGWWLIAGFPGLREALLSKLRRIWIMFVVALMGWSWLSSVWGYTRITYPSVTISSVLPFTVVILFSIVIICYRLRIVVIAGVMVMSVIWNSIVAGLQVAAQNEIGLQALGEFSVDPLKSGTVIVQAGDIRWLRPYGLLPHPNMLAGFLAVGLLIVISWLLTSSGKRWLAGVVITLFGLWILLLTFSWAAWLGFAGGAALLAIVVIWRSNQDRRRLIRTAALGGATAVTLGAFVMLYQPFLAARAGIGDESVELRSVSDRSVYNQIAFEVIGQSPILGIGLGNFPWYAANYLAKTDFDLKGQPVHNIFLAAWSELGIIGLAITSAATGLGIWIAIREIKQDSPGDAMLRVAVLGGVGALMIIGLFDHYPWTQPQFQVAWWGLLATAGKRGE
ncbi:MAG: O-antigen ligase family protein [Anaerolineae bacterium]